MSTTFTLGLEQHPRELFQGMDKNSAFVCDVLQRQLGFPQLKRATPYSTAWTAKKPGVITTIGYASERLAGGFEHLTGIPGRLLVSLRVDKTVPWGSSLADIFSTAHGVLARTDWDAAFCYEFDHVILRRIRGETFIEDIPDHILRGDIEGLLRQLDPSGEARRGFRQTPR